MRVPTHSAIVWYSVCQKFCRTTNAAATIARLVSLSRNWWRGGLAFRRGHFILARAHVLNRVQIRAVSWVRLHPDTVFHQEANTRQNRPPGIGGRIAQGLRITGHAQAGLQPRRQST